jgi:hypothetical protein
MIERMINRSATQPDARSASPASVPGASDLDAGPVARIGIGIATRGRAGVLRSVVSHLRQQTLQPRSIVVAGTSPDDVRGLDGFAEVTVLLAQPGLARQRNAILQHLPEDIDIVAFFDDDFVADRDWLAAVETAFRAHPDLGCVTGHVVADGIKGMGLGFEEACTALAAGAKEAQPATVEEYSPYGCNMAFRRRAIEGLRFDERLVLYGWLEDRDFGGALARRGWRRIKLGSARGVHMGVKSGRVAGCKLGYSQVMNPVYLHRKGTMRLSAVADHVTRNVTMNLMRSFAPEPYIDRRGRLRGNMLAAVDLLRGRLTPERAERL